MGDSQIHLGKLFITQLKRIVGSEHCLVDPDVTNRYEVDWTGRYRGRAGVVVRPANAAQVAEILSICCNAEVPLVPQGGNTGLVGGSVPRGNGQQVLLSLQRLVNIGEVDTASRQVTVEAGVTLSALNCEVSRAGLHLAVDLAARDSATIGGMTATNAGGVHVIRHGAMRSQVSGIEAALIGGGFLSRMSDTLKDNVGYDLPGLLTGSEGTLAVLTAVRLRLQPICTHRVTTMLAIARDMDEPVPHDHGYSGGPVPSPSATANAVRIVAKIIGQTGDLDAAEIFYPADLGLIETSGKPPQPFGERDGSVGAYLLLELCRPDSDPVEVLAAALGDEESVIASAVTSDPAAAGRLWELRERLPEAASSLGIPHKIDVAVPLRHLPELVGRLPDIVESLAPRSRLVCFGHVGDGNLHINIVGPPPDDLAVDDKVCELAAELGGSISAEHGVGIAKAHLVDRCRSHVDIEMMSSIKRALDPKNLLNPGVLFPLSVDGGVSREWK